MCTNQKNSLDFSISMKDRLLELNIQMQQLIISNDNHFYLNEYINK